MPQQERWRSMKLRTVIIAMALFFCFIPLARVGADTTSSAPGIDINQDTLDDLNDEANDAQQSIDDITDSAGQTANKEIGKSDHNYGVGDKKPLYIYTSYLDTDNKIKVTVNMGVQGLFYVAKQEYSFTDWIDGMLSKINVVKDYSKTMLASGKVIYDDLITNPKNPVFWFIVLFILYSLIRGFLKGRLAKTVLVIFGLFLMNSAYFNLGGTVIDEITSRADAINTSVVQKITVGGVSNAKPDLLQTMVITPFERMNFDNEKQYGTKSDNVNSLLNTEGDAGKVAKIREAQSDEHLRFNEIGDKFSVAIGAIVNNFVLGCGVLLFKLGSIIAGVAFLVFLAIAPVVAFLTFLSLFEQASKNLMVKTGVTLILSIILSYGTTIFLSFNNLLDTIFGGNKTNFLFLAVVKVIVYVVIYKYRSFFLSVLGNASSAITNNRAFNAMDTAFSRAKQRTLQPIIPGGTAGIVAGKTFAKDVNHRVGTGAINRYRSANRFKKYGQSMKDILNPNNDEKKRNKATKRKERFEKRFEKQNKKAEKTQNKATSETKKKRANEKVAPYKDMKNETPETKAGQKLRDLKQKADQQVKNRKKMEQLRPASERMVKNPQHSTDKKPKATENSRLDKHNKQGQQGNLPKRAERSEKSNARFRSNPKVKSEPKPTSDIFKESPSKINNPTIIS